MKLKALFLSVCLALIFLFQCGKVGPPLPPLRIKPQSTTDLLAVQVGSKVLLSWSVPTVNTDGSPMGEPREVQVYRLSTYTRDLASPSSLTPDSFEKKGKKIFSIKSTNRDKYLFQGRYIYSEAVTLPSSDAPYYSLLYYAVRTVDSRGKTSAFSNIVSALPSGVAEAPGSFAAAIKEDRIEFRWAHPEKNSDGTSPPLLMGYNIYRRGEEGIYLAPRNSPVLPVKFLHWEMSNALSFQRKELDSGEMALEIAIGSSGAVFTLEQSLTLPESAEVLRWRSLTMGGRIRTLQGSAKGRMILDDGSAVWEEGWKKEITISPEWEEISHQMVIDEEAERITATIEVEPSTLPVIIQLIGLRAGIISPDGGEGENLLRNSDFSQLEEPVYMEKNFTFGARYYYVVRAVSQISPALCESDNSEELTVAPVDVFPPAPPAEVSSVTGGEVVLLSWAPNKETDLLGYNIYRRQDPYAEWEKINPTIVQDTFYRDTTVQPGRVYYYSLTAVDKASPPNESPKTTPLQVVAR